MDGAATLCDNGSFGRLAYTSCLFSTFLLYDATGGKHSKWGHAGQ